LQHRLTDTMPRKRHRTSLAFAGLIPFLLATMVSLSSESRAGGFDIAWNDCGNSGVEARSFSCNSDAGTNVFYVSAMPNSPIPQMVGFDAAISVYSSGTSLSPWWHLESTGGCRGRSLSANFNFVAGPFSCEDPWGGAAMGGIAWQYFGLNAGSRARIKVVCAVQTSAAIAANSGSEYYLCSIAINNSGATSTSCTGCGDALCFVLDQVVLSQATTDVSQPPTLPEQVLNSAQFRQKITWQSGANASGSQCASINTPKQSTWGGIKSIYH
jgi:hypothetical protein